jgi:isopentenyl-diphosphate delta-isomerase
MDRFSVTVRFRMPDKVFGRDTGRKTISEARRRLQEELGISTALHFGFLARYRVELDQGMTENEIVYVYFGKSDLITNPNPQEVIDIKYASLPDLEKMVAREPRYFTYWIRLYMSEYKKELLRSLNAVSSQNYIRA